MDEVYIFIQNNTFITILGDYQNDPDIINNLGETWDDYMEGKYVLLNEDQKSFLEEFPSSSPKEVFFMKEEEFASDMDKMVIIKKIIEYDSSEQVNTFYVNDVPTWFRKGTRVSISQKLSIEEAMGVETTALWINGIEYLIPISEAKRLLTNLEIYAMDCYSNTQRNIAEVQKLARKDELKAFDITKGYPDKLKFNL